MNEIDWERVKAFEPTRKQVATVLAVVGFCLLFPVSWVLFGFLKSAGAVGAIMLIAAIIVIAD